MVVNFKWLIARAYKEKWAIPHFNINNMEWLKTILLSAQESKSPVIVATSQHFLNYLGGLKSMYDLTNNFIDYFNITVPVILHLDHANYDYCVEALKVGYRSIMYDGSKVSFEENVKNTKILKSLADRYGASLETEVGSIGGVEDGVIGNVKYAQIEDVLTMEKTDVDAIAVGIGNIHGQYPKNWEGINFEVLNNIFSKTSKPLVLHGSSGIDEHDIKKMISLGISKINYNSELIEQNAIGLQKYIKSHESDLLINKNFLLPVLYKNSEELMKQFVTNKFKLLGSYGKAFD